MNSPWEILGVARDCSQSEIKQAYARLLKLHRPDKDPEGFRRIRDAFEQLRSHEAPVVAPAVFSIDPSILDQLSAGLEQTSNRVEQPSANIEPTSTATSSEEAGFDCRAMLEIVQRYAEKEDWPHAAECLDEMRSELKAAPSSDVADMLIIGAQWVALLNWKYAKELMDVAFPHLSPYGRARILEELDIVIQVAKELEADVDEIERSALCRCLATNAMDRSDPAVLRAWSDTMFTSHAHTAQAYFKARFPDARGQAESEPVNVPAPSPARRRPLNKQGVDSGSKGVMILFFMGILIFIRATVYDAHQRNKESEEMRQRYYPEPESEVTKRRLEREFKLNRSEEDMQKLIDQLNSNNKGRGKRETLSTPDSGATQP